MMGLLVIAPAKEPTQEIAEVTMLLASARIAARVPAVGVVTTPSFKNLCDMGYISDNPDRNDDKGEADEVADRLGHEERGKLRKEPITKGLHLSHGAKHLPV